MLLKFYFDYISPNAYLAWRQIPRLVARRNVEIEPIPVLFSALLDAHGQRGPAEIPAKMHWMVRDILWKAKRLGVALNPPVSHPFNPLLALRVSFLTMSADKRSALITAIFEAVWVQRVDVSDPSALTKALDGAGFEGGNLVAQASSPDVKNLLRERTSSAVEAGVFGVPSMLAGKQLFWGFDDFAHLEAFLDGRAPREDIQAWSNLTPSAWRENAS